jgi:hypothetical protein
VTEDEFEDQATEEVQSLRAAATATA